MEISGAEICLLLKVVVGASLILLSTTSGLPLLHTDLELLKNYLVRHQSVLK